MWCDQMQKLVEKTEQLYHREDLWLCDQVNKSLKISEKLTFLWKGKVISGCKMSCGKKPQSYRSHNLSSHGLWSIQTHTHTHTCTRLTSSTAIVLAPLQTLWFDLIQLFNRRTCSCSSSGRCSVLKWVWWNKLNAVFLAHPFLVKQSKEALAV